MQNAKFNPDSSLALEVLQNQWVVGRVLTRHVGLKPDLHPNRLSGFKRLQRAHDVPKIDLQEKWCCI